MDWEKSYFTPDHPHRKMFLDLLENEPAKAVLEVGCAVGANLWNIKQASPSTQVAGCDLNPSAIKTAQSIFANTVFPQKKTDFSKWKDAARREIVRESIGEGKLKTSDDTLTGADFKVGNILEIPFHGETFDLVITDACLIYISPSRMHRALRELRRVGYKRFIFCEFHSTAIWKRILTKLATGYNVYNYLDLLTDNYFKDIKFYKIPQESWSGQPWEEFGYFIDCMR